MGRPGIEKFIEDAVCRAVDKMQGANLNNPSTLAALSTQVERMFIHLRNLGQIGGGSVTCVICFEHLSAEDQARILAKYEDALESNACFPATFRAVLSDEEYRWLIREEWNAPAEVERALGAQASVDGLVDWEKYYDLLRQHPEAYLLACVEHPADKVLMDYTVTPVYPINYIKFDIALEEKDG